jgi:hypothetical protein
MDRCGVRLVRVFLRTTIREMAGFLECPSFSTRAQPTKKTSTPRKLLRKLWKEVGQNPHPKPAQLIDDGMT